MKEKLAGRKFQVWDYCVSHSQLLLRSPKDASRGLSNVDVRFSGVQYMELRSGSFALQIKDPDDSDRAFVDKRLEKHEDDTIFVLNCDGKHHYVVAFHMTIEENELDIFQSTLQRTFELRD